MPDFITPGLNPLEIPEIVAMVGLHIPICKKVFYTDLFNPTLITTTSVLAPRDLLACTAVSRAWRWILLPVLWQSYDGSLMRYVPLHVLQENSIYFRSFRDQFGHYHSGPFLTGNLRNLIISYQHDWAVPFMLTNPVLKHLTWTGCGHPFQDREFTALIGLCNLRDLCLSNWDLNGRQLALILCASPRLARLSLSSVRGVRDLDGMLLLFAMEEISLGYVPSDSQCLLELVRYCPGLRRISFLGTWIQEQPRDMLLLSAQIRVYCPEISSIRLKASYCFGMGTFVTLEDFEYAALVQGAQSLDIFAAEISSLGMMLTDALISQFDALVAVDLCIRRRIQHQHPHDGGGGDETGGSGVGGESDSSGSSGSSGGSGDIGLVGGGSNSTLLMDIINSGRILSTCSRLRVFRLSSAENVIDMDIAMELFSRPWACLGLEVLSLGQISLPTFKQPSQEVCTVGYEWQIQSFNGTGMTGTMTASTTTLTTATAAAAATTATITYGDTFAMVDTSPTSAMIPTLSTAIPGMTPLLGLNDELWPFGSEFRRKLLPQISLLTVLREFWLNKVQYVRATIV